MEAAARLNLTVVINTVRDFWGEYKGSYSNFVGMPYFQYTHWNPGNTPKHRVFDLQKTLHTKTTFMSQSFVVRGIVHPNNEGRAREARHSLYQQCMAAGNETCRHYWLAPDKIISPVDTLLVQRQMGDSWFNNQPRGDFITRSSYVDAIMAGSIPVFPLPHRSMAGYLPFGDVLDWAKFSVTVEDSEWDAECTCVDSAPDVMDRPCTCTGTTLIEALKAKLSGGQADIVRLTEALWRVRQVFQFSTEPAHQLVRWDMVEVMDPMEDAFTFTLKAVMRNLCRRKLARAERCNARMRAAQR